MNFDYVKEAEPSTDDLRQLYDSLYQNLEKAEELYWTKPQRCGMMLRRATEKICRIYNGYYEIHFPESATLEDYLCYTGDDDHNAMVSRFLSVVRKEQRDRLEWLRVWGDECVFMEENPDQIRHNADKLYLNVKKMMVYMMEATKEMCLRIDHMENLQGRSFADDIFARLSVRRRIRGFGRTAAEGTAEEFLVIPVWKERKVENTMKQFCRAANTEVQMKKILSGSYYIVSLLGVLFVVGSFLFATNETHFRKGEIAGHQQITPQSITQVDEMTKEYVFSGEQFTGKNICLAFYSIHLGIEVYEDGELIYDLKPVPGIFGTTPGSVWNFLEIEPGCGQVIVRTHAAYRRVGGETLSFYIGEAVDEVLYLIRNSAIGACVCLLELAIGIFLIMYFIIGNKGIRIENYVLYFGLFAVLMGAWSLNETVLMALLVKNTVAGSNLGYILIMLMPAPFAMFVQGFLMPEDKWAAGSITFLSVLNMAACVLLHMTGVLEFRNAVTFTHILMAMDILYLGYALVHYVKKHGMDRIAKTNIVGIIILFAAFAADIIFFYVISTVVDILGRTGFLVYICLLAWLAASDSMEKLHEGQKAAIYKELALKDILTGLYSRNAYDEWERDNQHPDKTAIVMLDLNNLKKCNDRYGHEAGDTYLKKASEMITNAFSQENTVYRIGGDEFCVIMPDAKENSIEGAMDRLKELQKQYKGTDHSVEVEIACGYAFYDDNVDQSFVDTRKRADTHMYENKRMLKGKEPR